MDTLSFLQRVLPSAGTYVSITINKNVPRQHFFGTIEELAKYTVESDKRGDNIYYAISSFKDDSSRKQINVLNTKTFCLDIDCGADKPYPTQREGLLALLKFIQEMLLPEPMIVSSGNGLHVYWTLTRELEPHEWMPIASAMKAACAAKNFELDMTVPADSARVLRAVGTHNAKGGAEVKIMVDRPSVTPETMAACLTSYMVAQPVSLPSKTRTNTLLQNLAVKADFPPAQAGVIANKCMQVGTAIKNQKDIQEPMWYALMGVAAFCEDSDYVAVEWSKDHPGFNQAETLKKVSHWRDAATGPTTCAKFEAENPKGCAKCRFKGKITSPCQLGVQHQEVAVDQTAPDAAASAIEMPKPFKRTATGIKQTIDGTDVDICPFDIYPVGYGKDEGLGYETVRFHWNRPHAGWQELSFRQAHLADGSREFSSTIADQGIVLKTKAQTEAFQFMLRSYMDKLREARSMTNLYSSMGWKEEYSQFVLGDTLFKRDANGDIIQEHISLAAAASKNTSDLFASSGDLAQWVDFTRLLDKIDLPVHQFCLGVSFAAPLYAFTGLKGGAISLYGGTGGGKSIAQLWMQSVWGNPDLLHYASKFTQNAVYSRLALLNNLPMTIDEATLLPAEFIGDFVYTLTQGRDKTRLNRNAEERAIKTWALPAVLSTNISLNSKLVSSGFATDAQLARMLELEVPVHPIFAEGSSSGRKVYHFLNSNYGVAGRELIPILMGYGESGCRAILDTAMREFPTKFHAKFSGSERYWEQIIVLAYIGLRIASDNNLIQFDCEKPIRYVLGQLGMIRQANKDNRKDSIDLLTEYVNEYAAESITMMYTVGENKPTLDYNRVPRNSLHIRYNVHRKTQNGDFDSGQIVIAATHFKEWLAAKNGDYRTFMRDMTMEGINLTPPTDTRYSLGKDTPIKTGQVYTVRISMQHPRLESMFGKVTQDVKELELGQMMVVK